MLNGKELMLGDYVNIADYDFPEAVGVVEEIYANGKEMYISIDGQAYDILSDKDISVLFLSKTFFLENGFKELHVYEDFTLLYNEDIKVVVKIIHGNCFKCDINGIKLEYVHEFQHLMRLLGLFKYANNLKA